MVNSSHIQTFAGLPVAAYGSTVPGGPADYAWRLSSDRNAEAEVFDAMLDGLFAEDWVGEVRAIIIGEWGDSLSFGPPLARLIGAADRLTGLRAIFLGELTAEENEISWIKQGDITGLLNAFPALEVLRVRGATRLRLTPLRHESLVEFAIESGGLGAEVVRAVGACDLPALRHLELWLGDDLYGGDTTVADLAPILSGTRLPSMEYLGLRDAAITDEIAEALASAPVVARLRTLDLSLGVFSDVGAVALLSGQPLTHLSTLDVSHNFLSFEMQWRLEDELPGVAVDTSDRQTGADDDERYIAVAE